MNFKHLHSMALTGIFCALCAGPAFAQNENISPPGFAGKYLASHFAQSENDWESANGFIGALLAQDPGNGELVRRSMVLAMGTGDLKLAVQRAQQLLDSGDPDTGLALMILSIDAMGAGDMAQAEAALDKMPQGDMTDFVKPVLKGWAAAGQGRFVTDGFNDTTIHSYHGALIATFLNNKEAMERYTESLLQSGTLAGGEAERAADMLVLLGKSGEAKTLYEGVFMQDDDNTRLADKIAELKKDNGGRIRELVEPLQIKTPQQGAARAMYDMAYILYHEQSDSSAKLFTYMTLALDPNLTDARLLLADTLTRSGRFDEAIAELEKVPEGHPSYLAVQRHMAELLAEAGRKDEALARLDKLFTEHNDVESLIRIGDLYRYDENYENALTAYNKAATHIGKVIPEKYWYLLYARGMTYEREGDWTAAEADLKAALVYRPDHPYLLNYLGYGWADQGINLEESLKLIKQAAELQPMDGYIIDSLGWVQYMMGSYQDALPNLERAGELLPYDSTINDHLGDLYWKLGRRNEAKFQWERALNYCEDETLKDGIAHKMRYGLEAMSEVKHAGVE